MDKKPVVNLSVILPTYGRDKILTDVLQQLIDQHPQPLEIIVVDQTRKHNCEVNAFLDSLIRENKIRYIIQKEPHANVARNRGILEAKGEIVLILNDDIIIKQDLIRKHFANFDDPSVAAVSGAVLEGVRELTDEFPRSFYRRYTGWIHFPLNYSKRVEVINLNSCNLSIRREIIMEVGGFDENFSLTYFDDSDFSLRVHRLCLKKGLKTLHDPRLSIIHLKEPTGGYRPGGINDYVVADRYAWMTWLYFFLLNFGFYGSWDILIRLRSCVFRKKNILRPYYLWVAFLEFIIGLDKALALIRHGRKLIS
ncbi:glycosyltransferase family 2 protein [bacterium]|nr:MAG: glycosyltransferase family 2 protein [bacterium]